MRGSEKGLPPDSFVVWKSLANDAWQPTYEILQNPEKGDLVDTLLREQAGCCAYCGRSLKRDDFGRTSHIDHFRPQSLEKYSGLDLEHTNLFLSCGPERAEDRSSASTCGHVKGNWFDEESHIDPVDFPCARHFEFLGNGEIRELKSSGAATMIAVLKLNDPELVRDRADILAQVELEIALNDEDDVLNSWADRDPNGFELGYSCVVTRYFGRNP